MSRSVLRTGTLCKQRARILCSPCTQPRPQHVGVYPDLPALRSQGMREAGQEETRRRAFRRLLWPHPRCPQARMLLPVGWAAACPAAHILSRVLTDPSFVPSIVTAELCSPAWRRCSDLTSCLFPLGSPFLTSLPACSLGPCSSDLTSCLPSPPPPSVVFFKSLPENVFIASVLASTRD